MPKVPAVFSWIQIGTVTTLTGVGWFIGAWLDRKEDLRMTRFRDKSALYGRVLAPGEAPSWP